MSQPQFAPVPDITRQDAINQVISSIASEELALSHVINAEGEKIQYALGTISGIAVGSTIADVISINSSASDLLGSVLENQILLNGKLADALSAPVIMGATGAPGPIGPQGTFEGAAGAPGPVGLVGANGPEGLPGAVGDAGATGAAGAAGATGTTGATGQQGLPAPLPPPTATAGFATNTTGSLITVPIPGSNISFPSTQLLSADITLTGGNTLFTINTAGLYRISYHVNTTAALLMGTRLVVNAAIIPQSTIPPVLSVSQFYNEVELSLIAGSTVRLQIYSTALGAATLLGSGIGASLMIIRLS